VNFYLISLLLYPIKSKQASKIVKHLLHWISIFSNPKIVLSDQGKEFCNDVVNNLLSSSGIKHDTTSGWNPITNGKTERMNRTIIDSLRKLSEADTSKWIDYVPYVMLAYNTRIHSTTNYSPFELVFGRQSNKFQNWTNLPTATDVANLINRANEIKFSLIKHN